MKQILKSNEFIANFDTYYSLASLDSSIEKEERLNKMNETQAFMNLYSKKYHNDYSILFVILNISIIEALFALPSA